MFVSTQGREPRAIKLKRVPKVEKAEGLQAQPARLNSTSRPIFL